LDFAEPNPRSDAAGGFFVLPCRSVLFPAILPFPTTLRRVGLSARWRATGWLLALAITGCDTTPGTLSQLDPSVATAIQSLGRQQENSAVVVAGRVITVAPLIGRVAYEVQDGTGTIWVLANRAPAANSEVKVHGTLKFESVPIEGQEAGGVYIQQR
jgi:hypothetical protein